VRDLTEQDFEATKSYYEDFKRRYGLGHLPLFDELSAALKDVWTAAFVMTEEWEKAQSAASRA
jgi:hypothetical protein